MRGDTRSGMLPRRGVGADLAAEPGLDEGIKITVEDGLCVAGLHTLVRRSLTMV